MAQTFFKSDIRPAALEREDRRTSREAMDKAENVKVKSRSGGRCEAIEHLRDGGPFRCERRGNQTHHLIGGWGKRARGISLLAERKLWVCQRCHDEIGGHILKRVGGDPPHYTDPYERQR